MSRSCSGRMETAVFFKDNISNVCIGLVDQCGEDKNFQQTKPSIIKKKSKPTFKKRNQSHSNADCLVLGENSIDKCNMIPNSKSKNEISRNLEKRLLIFRDPSLYDFKAPSELNNCNESLDFDLTNSSLDLKPFAQIKEDFFLNKNHYTLDSFGKYKLEIESCNEGSPRTSLVVIPGLCDFNNENDLNNSNINSNIEKLINENVKKSIDFNKTETKLKQSSFQVTYSKQILNENELVNKNSSPASQATQFCENNRRPVISNMLKKRAEIDIRRERKAAKTLGVIMSCFILCWLPFFFMQIFFAICKDCYITHLLEKSPLVTFMTWSGYLNSLLNPVIYTIFSPDFRSAFAKILHGKYRFK